MDAEGADEVVERIVIREHRAAVAVAAQGFGREEGGGGDASEGAGLFPVIFRAEALGGVLDEGKAVLFADGGNCLIVAGVAENVHRHDCFRCVFPLCQHCLDLTLKACGVKVVGVRGDVAENAHRAEHGGRLRGGNEGHIGGEHSVPLPHAQRHERKLEGVGSVGAGDAVLAAGKGGKLDFQFPDIFAADERGIVQNLLHIRVDLVLEGGVLGFQVDELHGITLPFEIRLGYFSGILSMTAISLSVRRLKS